MRGFKMKLLLSGLIFGCFSFSYAQDSLRLSLHSAVEMGIDSSQQLMLVAQKIKEAIAEKGIVNARALPQAKISLMGSEALIPTQTILMKDIMAKPLELPSHSTMYIGQLGISQVIFGGNKIRYAKASAELLAETQRLKAQHSSTGVMLSIIKAYLNLYKIDQNIKIITRSIHDIEGRVRETVQFKKQGLATQNDVLRFKLEQSNMKITLSQLNHNRNVANFTLVILLGLPQNTIIKEDNVTSMLHNMEVIGLTLLLNQALTNREDLKVYDIQKKMNLVHLKQLKGNKLPTLAAGANVYYLNPNDRFIPENHTFLVPITIGLNLSWNISSLYTNKHKEKKVEIAAKELVIAKKAAKDKIFIAVNKCYQQYQANLQHIELLQTSVKQAEENDRIMEEKYKNQLATTTDRIDAQTLYYKSLIALSIAKAAAIKAYYKLKAVTGTLQSEL